MAMTNREPALDLPLAELIDRMVDGGLTPAQLRRAVAELDRAPDGWKRCALSFLEAQCWSESLRNFEEGEATGPSVIAIPSGARRRWIAAALAACVSLMAFSLGWLGHSLKNGSIDERRPDARLATVSGSIAGDTGGGATDIGGPGQPGRAASRGLPSDRLPTIREVARLRVDTGGPGPTEIPLFAGPGIDPRTLLEQPPAISAQGRAAWQRRGYQLEQERRLVSIPLGGGRRAAVPIDQVHVRYVGQDPL
jgi:hypothetical protein